MKLKLPDVTLYLQDMYCPELARLSLQDSMALVDFGDVLVCSPANLGVPGTRWHKIADMDLDQNGCFFWYEVPKLIRTGFVLLTDWDGWVIDAGCWDDAFLDYDYVGAPWEYSDLNVGCGAALRSLRLMRFLDKHRDRFPHLSPEDNILCRRYRPALEMEGFRWAPEHVAARFGFECSRPSGVSRHFRFHAARNFPLVMNGDRLQERVRLMYANPYIRSTDKIDQMERGIMPQIMPRLAAYDFDPQFIDADEMATIDGRVIENHPARS